MKTMVFEEVDDQSIPTGRRAEFVGVEFTPLGYSELLDKRLGNKVDIPLNWRRAKVIESNIPNIKLDSFVRGNAFLESFYTTKAIGLVKGGWLPSGLAVRGNMIILPDRCTISELKGRFLGGEKRNEDDKDFLDFLGGDGIRINPLLYALEGNNRRHPTPDLAQQQLMEVYAAIRVALPMAELVPSDTDALQGVIGLIQDTQAGMERKQAFLMQLAPKLQAPTSVSKKAKLWSEALAVAKDCGIPANSLVVLAVLSTISVPRGSSPAKRLLKPSANYSEENAYNALADLRSLEILMCLFALFPDQEIMLCTGDKNLALFWAGIRASNFSWTGEASRFSVSPIEAFLPGVSEEERMSLSDESGCHGGFAAGLPEKIDDC